MISKTLNQEQKDKLMDSLEMIDNDPVLGVQLKKIIKQKFPDAEIPELAVIVAREESEKKIDEKLAASEKRIAEFEAAESKRRSREALIKRGTIKEADIPEVEKFMTENGMSNFEKAADFYAMSKKMSVPASPVRSHTVQLPSHEGLMKDRNKWGREMAFTALAELEQARGNA